MTLIILFSLLPVNKTIVYSAILPGSADWMNGYKKRGAIHLTAEAVLWGGALWYNWNAGKTKTAYRDFAYLEAGASPIRDDEEYLDAMERYRTAKEYNDYIENVARDMYGDDIEKRDEYIQEHYIPPDQAWEWQSDSLFKEYIKMRQSERFERQMVVNAVGLAILNRIIDVLANPRLKEKNMGMYLSPKKDGYRFTLKWNF